MLQVLRPVGFFILLLRQQLQNLIAACNEFGHLIRVQRLVCDHCQIVELFTDPVSYTHLMERIAISFNVLPEMPGKREALVCCIPLQAQRDEHARRCRTPFCTGLFCIAYAPLNRIRIFTGVVKKRRGGGVCRYCGNTK